MQFCAIIVQFWRNVQPNRAKTCPSTVSHGSESRLLTFGIFFSKITQKMQNKGPKKGKIGPQKALINKTRLGGALRAPPNLVFAGLFGRPIFPFLGPLFCNFGVIFEKKCQIRLLRAGAGPVHAPGHAPGRPRPRAQPNLAFFF